MRARTSGAVRRLLLSTLAACALVTLTPLGARAAPTNAPSLTNVAARQTTQVELASILASLTDDDRARVKTEGLYVAFDPSATSLVALASCDDDGDPVIVLSDAMLSLVDVVARAQATDDLFGTHKVQDYAVFLGRLQSEGARTLPPPPGFQSPAQANDPRMRARADARKRDLIDALVAHEVAHFAQGDLTCPHPTATRESGDSTWTDAEARAAQSLGDRSYSASRVLAADATAAEWLVKRHLAEGAPRDAGASGEPEDAYVALLTVFDQLPASSYARFHQVPGTTTAGSVRIEMVRASAARTRARTKPGASPH